MEDNSNLAARLSTLERSLERKEMEAKKWWTNASTVVSLVAVLITVATTAYNVSRLRQQDRHDRRVELRAMLQRLMAIPKDEAEVSAKYDYINQGAAIKLRGALGEEVLLISKQADSVASSIADDVTSTENVIVAGGLAQSGLSDRATIEYQAALEKADTANEEMTVRQGMGQMHYFLGDEAKGREQFDLAFSACTRHPCTSEEAKAFSQGFTYLVWANAELVHGDCENAMHHLDKADAELRKLPQLNGTPEQSELLGQTGVMKVKIQRGNVCFGPGSPGHVTITSGSGFPGGGDNLWTVPHAPGFAVPYPPPPPPEPAPPPPPGTMPRN